jgi:peroxiredoxin Q/BCP
VVVYAASLDTPQVNRAFAEWTDCGVPILCDVTGDVAEAYGVVDEARPLPARMTFFIDRNGRIAHIDREVSPTSHGNDILQRARALGLSPIARLSRMTKAIRRSSRRVSAQP